MFTVGYGIGRNYQENKEDFECNSIKLDYLCDARWNEFGELYDDIPVISPDTLKQMKNAHVLVMVTEQNAYREIIDFLESIEMLYTPLNAVLLKKKRKNFISLIEQSAKDHTLSAIYDALQDSESEILFNARLKMSMYGDQGELYKALVNIPREDALIPVSEPYYSKVSDDLLGTIGRLLTFQDTPLRKKVVLCRTSGESYAWIKALGLKIDAVLEDKNGVNFFSGYEEIDIDTAVDKFSDAIFLSGDWFDGEIKNALISRGISPHNFKMRHTCWKSQYFDEPFIQPLEHEVFVDAGVLDLNNTFDFLRLCKGKCDKVYALEPDAHLYEKCLKRIEDTELPEREKIKLFHAAAWSCDTVLSFTDSAQGSCEHISDTGNISVTARSIDSILQGNRVTYIKMDIEGAELEALKGAKESIRKWRPRLAICIYHKLEDVIELPAYILSLVPDYKMYIRHYSTCTAETVLYCL